VVVCLALAAPAGAGPSNFSLQSRDGYLGDPYLSTNAMGQVSLVINPELFGTNTDYQAKVAALAGLDQSEPQGPWAFLVNASRQVTSARLHNASASRPRAMQGRAQPAPINDADFQSKAIQFSYVIQRWLLFVLVTIFLLRRVWRYFREVEDDDDFANHLATLAMAHRWIFPVYLGLLLTVAAAEYLRVGNLFFSVSLLLLASTLRGYFCEGDFADFPKLQKLHLALSLILVGLGWMVGFDNYLADVKTWVDEHGLRNDILVWLLLATFTRAFRGFINGPDLAQQRQYLVALLIGFLLIGFAGGGVGGIVWFRLGWRDHAWHGCVAGAIFACFLLSVALFASRNPVFLNVFGGTVVDMFFPRLFGPQSLRKRHLPSLLLLHHWRDHGNIDQAWQQSRAHLLPEPRALPVWLFALETAILYRRQPEDALQILDHLCATEAFSYDHRTVAVADTQEWMVAAGFAFEIDRYQLERPRLEPTELADRVEQKCQAGQANEAAAMLRGVLDGDSLNETAFVQLIRVYCQDLKNRRGAQRLIAEAADTFSPKLLAYLERTLDEWIQMPTRSTVKPRSLLAWLLPPKPAPRKPEKITLTSPPITQKPRSVGSLDPMESYLERVRESHGQTPDTSGVMDRAEKLLLERRLGTAVELMKQQAEAAPDDFDLWLRYAEAHGHHCSDPAAADKIVRQMERSGHFKKAQMKKAHTRLKKWWKLHATHQNNW